MVSTVERVKTHIETSTILQSVILTTSLVGFRYIYIRKIKRYPTVHSLPPRYFSPAPCKKPAKYIVRPTLYGTVTSVGDADNFRLYHTPGGRLTGWNWLRSVPETRKELKDQTIHIRLAGVDAPEMAHFGRPKQIFSDEAYVWLENYVGGKKVRVQVWGRDRYDRVVGLVKVRRWGFKKDVSLEMLKAGWATVYTAQGAVYGDMLEKFQRAEEIAREKRVGMWQQNMKKYVSPAEYKRSHGRLDT
ncbi:putative endonuclease lcl3 [Neolecta irregularis DAH-3]|uniref:Probable endonuclease LCL3 n=1 Tax=Neolecta irregularis (strain DAH-3) TaxID=1198029 RepID=A0A1U7LHL8_NEOID|nr:putative endonuclease lcl3 [Neolecta irregularis DAH-3]|eukprot:OLL22147.1 putative endonuclease lcl3 [Neolecta irregularis DAH-3]